MTGKTENNESSDSTDKDDYKDKILKSINEKLNRGDRLTPSEKRYLFTEQEYMKSIMTPPKYAAFAFCGKYSYCIYRPFPHPSEKRYLQQKDPQAYQKVLDVEKEQVFYLTVTVFTFLVSFLSVFPSFFLTDSDFF